MMSVLAFAVNVFVSYPVEAYSAEVDLEFFLCMLNHCSRMMSIGAIFMLTIVTTQVQNSQTLGGVITANMFMWIIIYRVFMSPHNRAIDTDRNRARIRLITNVKFIVASEIEPAFSSLATAATFIILM
ncbi:hypothetical protein FGO68_gene16817 [Halteria grandinella]|uniref:Uncharacterized protein n=1 Tax=Halteria grandinella TaxID=5974 RepID=A0A8J8P3H2_HALGN|nr:hypothetical protein FGO68_gene16817 [Halteria grandinella]